MAVTKKGGGRRADAGVHPVRRLSSRPIAPAQPKRYRVPTFRKGSHVQERRRRCEAARPAQQAAEHCRGFGLPADWRIDWHSDFGAVAAARTGPRPAWLAEIGPVAKKGEPPNLALLAFSRMRDEPVSAWEALRDAMTDPRQIDHMTMAIEARKRLEADNASVTV